jgi:ribonucleoside-diphosphate reductase beta chain
MEQNKLDKENSINLIESNNRFNIATNYKPKERFNEKEPIKNDNEYDNELNLKNDTIIDKKPKFIPFEKILENKDSIKLKRKNSNDDKTTVKTIKTQRASSKNSFTTIISEKTNELPMGMESNSNDTYQFEDSMSLTAEDSRDSRDSRDELLGKSSDSVQLKENTKIEMKIPKWKKEISKGISQYVPFPLKNKDLLKIYKDARSVLWTEDAIDLSLDADDFDKLSPAEQRLLKLVFAFFARSDGLVNDNLVLNFYPKVQIPEARLFYAYQIFIESIHAITYARIIITLVKDPKERKKLLKDIDAYKSVGKKEKWIKDWIETSGSFAKSCIAFICVEGIFFSAAFAILYWFRHYKKGLLPGTMKSNDFIARDESTHAEENVALYLALDDSEKLTSEEIKLIFSTAVEREKEFVQEALPDKLNGMSTELMSKYVEYVADYWLQKLGEKPLFNVMNPFQWMDLLDLKTRGNFFENRNHEYVTGTKKGSMNFDNPKMQEMQQKIDNLLKENQSLKNRLESTKNN